MLAVGAVEIGKAEPPSVTESVPEIPELPNGEEAKTIVIETAKEGLSKAKEEIKGAPESQKLKILRERAKAMQERRIATMQDFKEGKKTPYANLKEKWPAYTETANQANLQYQQLLQLEENSEARIRAESTLLKLIQPIGPYLEYSVGKSFDRNLTPEQAEESKRLSSMEMVSRDKNYIPEEMWKDAPHLDIIGSEIMYTFLHVPIPLAVKTIPGAYVYFETIGGGKFENGITMIETRANEEGVAAVTWVSHGSSIGPGEVIATSPQAINQAMWAITVAQPTLQKPTAWTEAPGKEIIK